MLASWLPELPAGSLAGLMLETEDVAAFCERLRAEGRPADGPFETPWGRQATVTDPDGNEIVLVEPPSEDA